jgi:hypothetical protein
MCTKRRNGAAGTNNATENILLILARKWDGIVFANLEDFVYLQLFAGWV